jgi:hypothetical protein
MKKLAFIILLISMITIVHFFIKEQFNKIVLSQMENIVLSVTYLLVGVSLLILFLLKNKEDKKKSNSEK